MDTIGPVLSRFRQGLNVGRQRRDNFVIGSVGALRPALPLMVLQKTSFVHLYRKVGTTEVRLGLEAHAALIIHYHCDCQLRNLAMLHVVIPS